MRKEEIESAAKILSEIKDSLGELESALKSNRMSRANAAKVKLMGLQHKMKELI